MSRFVVVVCSRCHRAWSAESRHHHSSCPRCPASVDLRRRRRFWEGDDAATARQAAAAVNAALEQGIDPQDAAEAIRLLAPEERTARHDSAIDAAAAKARPLVNKSQRAEAVALWLTRLQGPSSDDDYMAALRKAGLAHERAEKEIIRMLACDVVFEPRPGHYAALQT